MDSVVKICPTCGREFSLDANTLWQILLNGIPHRQVYLGSDGNWYVTYLGQSTTHDAVQYLLHQGIIQPCYNDMSGTYHIGRTIDMKATLELRKQYRRSRDAPLVYVGDSAQGIAEGDVP